MDFSIIKRQVTVHLLGWLDKLNNDFPELTEEQAASYLWIANLFTENIEEQLPATSTSILLKYLLTYHLTETMRARFTEVQLEAFWSQCGAEFLVCQDAAVKVLILFSTTYLCEVAFQP